MIDIHAHVLPGVDDGPKSPEDAISLVWEARKNGIDTIIATPHYRLPNFKSDNKHEAFRHLREAIWQNNIDIQLHLGNEIYLDEASLSGLEEGFCNTLGDSSYILVEMPSYKLYPYHENLLHQLKGKGYRIILAHVERAEYLTKDDDLLDDLKAGGYYLQVNAGALLDKRYSRWAMRMIRRGEISIISSDCHNLTSRRPLMKEAYRAVEDQIGGNGTQTLFYENGRRILADEPLIDMKTITTKFTELNQETNTGLVGRINSLWGKMNL